MWGSKKKKKYTARKMPREEERKTSGMNQHKPKGEKEGREQRWIGGGG